MQLDREEQTSRFISVIVLLLIQASYGFNLERVCYRHSYLECHVSDMTLHTRSCALRSFHTLKDQCNNHRKWSELRQLRSSKGNATWLWFDSSAIDITKPLSKEKGRHQGPPYSISACRCHSTHVWLQILRSLPYCSSSSAVWHVY